MTASEIIGNPCSQQNTVSRSVPASPATRSRKIAATLAFVLSSYLPAIAAATEDPTFDFDDVGFESKLNARAEKDQAAALTKCVSQRQLVICRFDSAPFDKAVAALKELDLLNGKFRDKAVLKMHLVGGKVSQIDLDSERSDPANLFQLISKIDTLVLALDPSVSEDDASNVASRDLGLMRGDNDHTIGQEKTVIKHAFAASCIQFLSSESMRIHCEFLPRS